MLILGLSGELNKLDYKTAIILGFLPFIYYFKLIYDKYMIKKVSDDKNITEKVNDDKIINEKLSDDKIRLFWFFAIVWTLYGVVAFLPYEQKNTAYNILDLFSKNLFGIFLVYILWSNRIKTK
jgi:hypothetical protein